ncbi:MAG: hypothetical protein J7J36_02145 [Thermoplasmata archaeon]|nr:hypothetical protein [Thermoplasmata archaeon]
MLKKIFKKIKIYSTIVLIIGVAIYLAFVYNAAKSIKIVDKRIGGVNLKNPLMPDEYEVKFIIVLKNPKNTEIEVDYISYKVYIEDEYLGEGEKPHFFIEHGIKNYTFVFSFSIYNLTSSAKELLINGEANMTIKGEIMIPLKFLSLFTWKYIKIPYTIHRKVATQQI